MGSLDPVARKTVTTGDCQAAVAFLSYWFGFGLMAYQPF